MRDFEKRLRRLEQQFARFDVPSLDEVGAAFGRVAERAKTRFRGEIGVPCEEKRREDKDTIERWAKAEGADLENEAMRAREKLRNVDRAPQR